MVNYKILLVICCFILPAGILSSWSQSALFSPFVKHITSENGLSNNACQAITRDSDGFVWIGTENGLNRYDGNRFILFKNDMHDANSLGGNRIYSIGEDNNRNIWVNGLNFLSRYSMDDKRFYNYPANQGDPHAMMGSYIENYFVDRDGRFWLSNLGAGLQLYRPETNDFEYYLPDSQLPWGAANRVSAITQSANGIYWVGTHNGLYSFDLSKKQFHHYPYPAREFPNASFYNQCQDVELDPTDENLIWYGTWGTGLHSYNISTGEHSIFKYTGSEDINLSNIVLNITMRDSTSFWIGTEQGLYIFHLTTRSFEFVGSVENEPNSITRGQINDSYQDRDGILWVCTYSGVDIIDPSLQHFKTYTLPERDAIIQIHYHKAGKQLVGIRAYTNRAVIAIDPSDYTIQEFSIPGADANLAEPLVMTELQDGRICLGMVRCNPMLLDLSAGKFERLNLSGAAGIPEKDLHIRAIQQDRDGNLWFAQQNLILKFDLQSKTISTYPSAIPGQGIQLHNAFSYLKIHQDEVFALSRGDAIVRINAQSGNGAWIPLEMPVFTDISDCELLSDGSMWLSTYSHGLYHCEIDGELKILHHYYEELSDVSIHSIWTDRHENLWLASFSGLTRMDARSGRMQTFNEEDGLHLKSLDGAMCESPDGTIYTINGSAIVQFHPDQLHPVVRNLRCVLNRFLVNDKEHFKPEVLGDMRQITLQPGENNFNFDYSTLVYSFSGKLEYAYKLEGLDEGWHYTGKNHGGGYTNIPPGSYTLHLKCILKDDQREFISSVNITVHPHFYQTWWFRLIILSLMVASLTLLIVTYIRRRVRRLHRELENQREVAAIRTRIARDIHDEIGVGLTRISLMSKRIERSSDESETAKKEAGNISTTSRQLVQNLGEIVWTINPENDSLADLIGFLRNYATSLFENSEIKLKLQLPEITDAVMMAKLHPEVKRNLLLIIKETLNNCIRHSGATVASLEICFEEKELKLTMADDGHGFNYAERGRSGNGLRNMKKRAEEIRAVYMVVSSEGKGTTSTLSLRLN